MATPGLGARFRTLSLPIGVGGLPDSLDDAQTRHLLASLPVGRPRFWGIPFAIRTGELEDRWLWVGHRSGGTSHLVPIGRRFRFLVIVHFAVPANRNEDAAGSDPEGATAVPRAGEHLANYVLEFEDGTQQTTSIRRRFEIADLTLDWGYAAFAARPHRQDRLLDWRGPHDRGRWGRNQTSWEGAPYSSSDLRGAPQLANYWVYALENPRPDAQVIAVHLTGVSGLIGIGGMTAFQGDAHPLRHRPLETLRIVRAANQAGEPRLAIDLGLIGAVRQSSGLGGLGWLRERPGAYSERSRHGGRPSILIELAANEGATLKVDGERFAMSEVFRHGIASGGSNKTRVEVLPAARQWVHWVIRDGATGRPTPVRLHVHDADGRYLPPYGHRHEVNAEWFEDYGADLQVGRTPYAYVNGSFDMLMPVGDAFVEISKGFEYTATRQRVRIAPGQVEAGITIDRAIDWRTRGWVTADSHVHFLSPQTARLEAQAEGVNIVNLLAAQWGDMFSNYQDIDDLGPVSSGETIVRVGSENRQHILGHLGLLGGDRRHVVPLSASGAGESDLGDPVWASLADWADACRAKGGLAIAPHFPVPYCEVVADIALEKIDAVEIADLSGAVETDAMREWYRLLNAGFRVPVVGGTDKMSAGIPLGGVRTYAHIGQAQLTFEAWADAVRGGRTFTTSGPLIEFSAEGQGIGSEIGLGRRGGSIEVWAEAIAQHPLAALQILHNGQVIAAVDGSRDGASGSNRLTLRERLRVSEDGWLAARCVGPTPMYWPFWASRPIATSAHTSPIYLRGSERKNSLADVDYLVALVDGGITWLETLATVADPERQRHMLGSLRSARARLDARP